jgi:hypothetical protein
MKHIDEISEADQEEVARLVGGIQSLWEIYGVRRDEQAQTELTKATVMIKRIEELGFMVGINYQLSLTNLKLAVAVNLFTSALKSARA